MWLKIKHFYQRISSLINEKEEFDLLENNLQELMQYVIENHALPESLRTLKNLFPFF